MKQSYFLIVPLSMYENYVAKFQHSYHDEQDLEMTLYHHNNIEEKLYTSKELTTFLNENSFNFNTHKIICLYA